MEKLQQGKVNTYLFRSWCLYIDFNSNKFWKGNSIETKTPLYHCLHENPTVNCQQLETEDVTNNGTVTATVSSGTPNYTYNWENSVETGNQLTDLSAGTYCVTVTDANMCTVSDCATVVLAGVAPVADFEANQTSACGSIEVQFTDQSLYNPTSWNWDFGDNITSTEESPTHTYSEAGVYTVSLTVTNSVGSDAITKTNYITVYENPTVVLTATNVSWDATNDGRGVTTDVSGGAEPYVYYWSNEQEDVSQITGLSVGEYCVTVTDITDV